MAWPCPNTTPRDSRSPLKEPPSFAFVLLDRAPALPFLLIPGPVSSKQLRGRPQRKLAEKEEKRGEVDGDLDMEGVKRGGHTRFVTARNSDTRIDVE